MNFETYYPARLVSRSISRARSDDDPGVKAVALIRMKTTVARKMVINSLMIIILPLLMAYILIGENVHEYLGICMGLFFIIHNILNYRWYRDLFKGRWSSSKSFQTLIILSLVIIVSGSMVSGILMSKHAFAGLGFEKGMATARIVHLLCSYWGFVLMNIHLGMHWNVMKGLLRKAWKHRVLPKNMANTVRLLSVPVAIFGIVAMIKTNVLSYMFLTNTFVFFNLEQSLPFFLTDYLPMMGLWILIGHYSSRALKAIPSNKRK